MAYVPVPKDLTKVKSKFLFGLTKRQVICFGIGAVCGLPVFFLTKGAIGTTIASRLFRRTWGTSVPHSLWIGTVT